MRLILRIQYIEEDLDSELVLHMLNNRSGLFVGQRNKYTSYCGIYIAGCSGEIVQVLVAINYTMWQSIFRLVCLCLTKSEIN